MAIQLDDRMTPRNAFAGSTPWYWARLSAIKGSVLLRGRRHWRLPKLRCHCWGN